MNEKNGYIKLHKKMLLWEWYDDVNTCRLFIHCLLKANWQSGSWHGIPYEPGQFITSLETLSKETRLTIRQVRTALSHLVSTGEVTSKRQATCRIITVVKWNEYQSNDKPSVSKKTTKRQGSDKGTTIDEEYKEYKEKEEIKKIYGEYKHVLLKESEYRKLIEEFGENKTKGAIKYLDEYIEEKGYKAKSHYLSIRRWVFDAVERDKPKTQKQSKDLAEKWGIKK